jgi:type IV pilus assembly protein PilQ
MTINKFKFANVFCRWFLSCVVFGLSLQSWAADTAPVNNITAIDVSSQTGDKMMVKFTLSEKASVPASFTVNNPPRIALDFPNTSNATGKNSFAVGGSSTLRSVNVVEVSGRTRVVLNMDKVSAYETRIDGNNLFLTLSTVGGNLASSSNVSTQFAAAPAAAAATGGLIKNIDFRRGKNGEGKIVVDLPSNATGIDIRQQGRNLVVDFAKIGLNKDLERRLDVSDFGTPVQKIDASVQGGNARMLIEPKGVWEYSAYQTDNQFVVEVKQIVEDPTKLTQGSKFGYRGDKLSLNFQNVEVRTVLQVIAEFTGMNIITSDTVNGSLTLRLKDVPWDQALDIILQAKGLDQRKNGNVVWIAPRDELALKEKLELESKQFISELEPLRTETFQLRYHNAEAIQRILAEGGSTQRLLSRRGSAVIDSRSNILFIQDVPSRLEEIRSILAKIDVPTKQVLIEARIVSAGENFSRELGSKFGIQGQNIKNSTKTGVAGNVDKSSSLAGGSAVGGADGLNWSFPTASSTGGLGTGMLGISVLNPSQGIMVNLELSAMEADGKGKVLSSPRIVTGDQQKAMIEAGVQVPYRTVSTNGTNVQFKDAVLSLAVTPRITPDGRVLMELEIKKDEPDWARAVAGEPPIDKKLLKTNVLVANGETAILGGVYEQNDKVTTTKVPLLGDLPIIGNLFKHTQKLNDRTELVVFITPKVLDDTMAIR